jgi:hypothetical protein
MSMLMLPSPVVGDLNVELTQNQSNLGLVTSLKLLVVQSCGYPNYNQLSLLAPWNLNTLALSMALRATVPLIAVTKAVADGLVFTRGRVLTFKATVHKDNQGAIILANLEPGRHTPRSKFYALRLHWFRSWLKPNQIEIIFIST